MIFQGKVAIVTGAATGIGRYVAHTFLHAGGKVAIVDVNQQALNQTVRDLLFVSRDVMAICADVQRNDGALDMAEQVKARHGRIDVLVNNAGIVPHYALNEREAGYVLPATTFNKPDVQHALGATYFCTKHVLPIMKRQGAGHIINVYGAAAEHDRDGRAAAESRRLLECFTRDTAREVHEWNICVLLMAPASRPILTEDAPWGSGCESCDTDIIAGRFVLASGASMDLSGRFVTCDDGYLDAAY